MYKVLAAVSGTMQSLTAPPSSETAELLSELRFLRDKVTRGKHCPPLPPPVPPP